MTRAERIIEARRKFVAGEFDRAIVKREPEDVDWDKITLECGHTAADAPRIELPRRKPNHYTCKKCAEAWIDETQ